MTKDEPPSKLGADLKKLLIIAFGGISALFIAAAIFGFFVAVFEHGTPSAKDYAIMLGGLTLLVGIVFSGWKLWPITAAEPVGQSVKKANRIHIALLIIGGLLGLYLALNIGDGPGSKAFFSNSPVSAAVAAISLMVWLVIVPIMTWQWWKTVDEHEKTAYKDGASVASHACIFIVPAWWMATRAGWLPEQDPMIALLAICFVWSAVWLYKKYA